MRRVWQGQELERLGLAALAASQSSFLVPAARPAAEGVTLGGGENWAWRGVLGVTVFVSGPQILCGSS